MLRWLQSRRRRRRLDRELDKELQFHLDTHTRDLIAAGVPPDEARRRARIELGGPAQVTAQARDVRPGAWIDQLLVDVRDALRAVKRTPGVTLTAVALIALVIGGNTTIYSMVHGLLTKPAPGMRADRLVTLGVVINGRLFGPEDSYPNYRDYAAQTTTVQGLTAYRWERFTLSAAQGSYAVYGAQVSAHYFETLGVRPVSGRTFTDEEIGTAAETSTDDEKARAARARTREERRADASSRTRSAAGLVAVISHRVWQQQLQGANVIGQGIVLNGLAATIVGVAPPGFHGATLTESADVWVPVLTYARLRGTAATLAERGTSPFIMIGRLAPDRSLSQARAEFSTISRRLQAAYPETNRQKTITVFPYSMLGTGSGAYQHAPRFMAIFSVVTLVTVLIVCANVANLMLARAGARQREMAVRQSLGASRLRIVRALLVEGFVIALAALGVACLFALWVTRSIVRMMPPTGQGITLTPDFTPDRRVLLYAMGLALVSTLAFTLAPAARAWRQELLPYLKAGERSVAQGRSRLTSALVVVQLAFSILLLTCAGLAYRSLSVVTHSDLGFNKDRLLLVTVNTAGAASTPATNAVLIDSLRERLGAVPGVGFVSYVSSAPPSLRTLPVQIAGGQPPMMVGTNHVGPGYLQALGVAPLIGRDFADHERSGERRVAVITQPLADALWPGRSAIGQTMIVGQAAVPAPPAGQGAAGQGAAGQGAAGQETAGQGTAGQGTAGGAAVQGTAPQQVEVVGVAPNAFFDGVWRAERQPFLFLSRQQEPPTPGVITFYVRYAGTPEALVPAIGRALRDFDARVPIVYLRTMETQLASITWMNRVMTTMLVMFAVGALVIAAIGQYAVMAFTMRGRTRDFGVRLALGASSPQILRLVIREGLRLTAIGLTIGFALSLAAGGAIRRMLSGIAPTDAVTYLGVLTVLGVVSLLACYLPARRAARTNPIDALRQE